jgi:hypothetical protein
MARVAAMSCLLCELLDTSQTSKTDVHHIRKGGQARNDFLVVPLCHDSCHQGPLGVEGTGRLLEIARVSEWDLLAIVIERLS